MIFHPSLWMSNALKNMIEKHLLIKNNLKKRMMAEIHLAAQFQGPGIVHAGSLLHCYVLLTTE